MFYLQIFFLCTIIKIRTLYAIWKENNFNNNMKQIIIAKKIYLIPE